MQDLDKFWALVIDVWTHGVGGVDDIRQRIMEKLKG